MRAQPIVMHLIDSLAIGGAERVAVNMSNELSRRGFSTHLCTTRAEGPLAGLVSPRVHRLALERRRRLSLRAAARLQAYLIHHRVEILHAHSTSVLVAVLASLAPPYPRVVWHDHYGRDLSDRSPLPIRVLARRVSAVVAVNDALVDWSRDTLRVAQSRVFYLPNFPTPSSPSRLERPDLLPGKRGRRVVCLANFRPQKDHPTLFAAMQRVLQDVPDVHLICVGNDSTAYGRAMRAELRKRGLDQRVSLLGERLDVFDVLRACDVGVLSSRSEGLPLALLEYGAARLPAVATRVGQCEEVLANGEAGILVPAEDPAALAEGLLELLRDPAKRDELGRALVERVDARYSLGAAVDRLVEVYGVVAGDRSAQPPS